jgi:hypothetical protein
MEMEKITTPMNMGIAGQVIRSGRTALVPDVRIDPLYCNQVEEDGIFVPRSMIAVPMIVINVAIGCIQTFNRCPDLRKYAVRRGRRAVAARRRRAPHAKIFQKALDPATVFTEREMASYVARLAKVKYLEIDSNFKPDVNLIKWIGEDTLQKYGILPLAMLIENSCSAVMANPNDFQRISDFEIVTGLKLAEKWVSAAKDIRDFVSRTFPKASQIERRRKRSTRIRRTEPWDSAEFKLEDADLDNENAGAIVSSAAR